MKTKTKVVCWCAATAVVLIMYAGCAMFQSDEERNKVVSQVSRAEKEALFGTQVAIIEQTNISADNALKTSDVYVRNSNFLQAYRIENHTIMNYRWSEYRRYEFHDSATDNETRPERRDHITYSDKLYAMHKAFWQLPNRLEQNEIHFQPFGNATVVTVTEMCVNNFLPIPQKSGVKWGNWAAWQWAGTFDEAPSAIETFRQALEQIVSVPKNEKSYGSYLRVIPLFTKEALEAEKDTPLIDLKKVQYHVLFALRHPYLLIPVPEQKTPFPAVRGYIPGDKFKVQCHDDGTPYYFLIETFTGQKPLNNKE